MQPILTTRRQEGVIVAKVLEPILAPTVAGQMIGALGQQRLYLLFGRRQWRFDVSRADAVAVAVVVVGSIALETAASVAVVTVACLFRVGSFGCHLTVVRERLSSCSFPYLFGHSYSLILLYSEYLFSYCCTAHSN